MVSSDQLRMMDDPTGHIDHRLLSPDALVRGTTTAPLRTTQQDFTSFNSRDGRAIIRGRDDYQFDNERVFG